MYKFLLGIALLLFGCNQDQLKSTNAERTNSNLQDSAKEDSLPVRKVYSDEEVEMMSRSYACGGFSGGYIQCDKYGQPTGKRVLLHPESNDE